MCWLRQPGLCSGLPNRRGDPRPAIDFLWFYREYSATTCAVERTLKMALASKSPPSSPLARSSRRIWNAPASPARWVWLAIALLLAGAIVYLYISAVTTQSFPGPFNEPLRSFGIIAFTLVLATATYSLRRRFARNLPGKVQAWLWMHTWLGCTAIIIALLHENFTHILRNYCQNASCLTEAYWGTSALLALFFLVISGLVGRLLD